MEFELPQIFLTVVVSLPALAAVGLVASSVLLGLVGLPSLPERTWRGVGLGAALVTLAVMVFGVALEFDPERIGLQQVETYVWSEAFGVNLKLGIDGLGDVLQAKFGAFNPSDDEPTQQLRAERMRDFLAPMARGSISAAAR